MTNEPRDRPQGIFGRFRNLVRALFAGWIRDGEIQNPRAVYEQAINERTRQYRELKEAVAGILYMRNKLEAEITERRAEIARLHDDIKRAVRRGYDDLSVSLIARKQALLDDLERAERELESVRCEAEEAKANLVRFREEIRSLVREKSRMLATLANARARRRIQEALEGLSVDVEMKALETVREHIARISTEGSLDRELGDDGLRTRLRAIRDEAREDAARRELDELKREMLPQAKAPPAVPLTHEAEVQVSAS
ncbi:MAG: PspA/IM30 family protein [Deltaproteobacteria bacterium]|nr:PspA/IM30 family protein [Deltaproteobacteria bacterium]MBW2360582.1 PspA/IM30 family protein [Deltaproteobacteria bacterium]